MMTTSCHDKHILTENALNLILIPIYTAKLTTNESPPVAPVAPGAVLSSNIAVLSRLPAVNMFESHHLMF